LHTFFGSDPLSRVSIKTNERTNDISADKRAEFMI